jgi:hypothetical protein
MKDTENLKILKTIENLLGNAELDLNQMKNINFAGDINLDDKANLSTIVRLVDEQANKITGSLKKIFETITILKKKLGTSADTEEKIRQHQTSLSYIKNLLSDLV